jgi:AmmeMemoRadiSam system protein B
MSTTLERAPAVAGAFYPGTPASLEAELDRCFRDAGAMEVTGGAIACVAPHAGYLYSGVTAAHAFGRVAVPRRVIVMGPNHTGSGPALSIWPDGAWRTPLGTVEIDEDMVGALVARVPGLEAERRAHLREHGAEVEVPFLQRARTDVLLTALVIATQDPEAMRALGEATAEAVRAAGEPVLLVASTDMNHFEDQATTERKDAAALERLEAMDPDGLLEVCRRGRISMCGVAPTAAVLHAAMRLGATRAQVVDHRTSGDISGDHRRVVGYAAAVIS